MVKDPKKRTEKAERRSKRLLIKSVIGFGGLILLSLVVRGLINHSSNQAAPLQGGQSEQSLPAYVLSQGEESQLKAFVQNFVSLYNSYSSGDYSNLSALGDYETESMQNKTAALITRMQQDVPPGFTSRTIALPSSFSYVYPAADQLTVRMQASVSQSNSITQKQAQFTAVASVTLQRFGSVWVVNDIKINK